MWINWLSLWIDFFLQSFDRIPKVFICVDFFFNFFNSMHYCSMISVSQMFTDRDKETGYDESASAIIQLNGSTAQCDSNAVQISGSTITITDEGTYILSGTLDNGMVIVDAEESDSLQLVLDGVSIHSATSAAIYIREADKVFITLAPDSENYLSNGGQYTAIDENNIDSALFSKADLTLNGLGALSIEADAGHGIVSKDDLVITSGTYQITAAGHGFSGKDSVRIADGTYTFVTGKDGMQAENEDDASLGFLYIADGTFHITADGDGLSAGSELMIDGGTYTILTGGGSENASSAQSAMGTMRNPVSAAETASSGDSTSSKGIKATGDLLLNSGTFTIDSCDDSLHSNADLTVNGGSYLIATGDDGLHADANLSITGGSIQITDSYEGIEGLSIDITGGEIHLTSSDDGLNAAGGNDQSGFGGGQRTDRFSAEEGAYINISGGTLYIIASGDGIDSNGSLTISGGETFVSGPESHGNGSLDYNSEALISGGVFVAAGASQMAQNFSSSSTQGAMMVSVATQPAGSTIRLTDSSGQELISWQSDTSFDCVIISCPEITQSATYTLTAGTSEVQITMDSLIYSSASGINSHFGNRR